MDTDTPAAAVPLEAARELLVEAFLAFCADPDSRPAAEAADLALRTLDRSIESVSAVAA
jgi:hypothetical protein